MLMGAMPRHPRIDLPDCYYHVFCRGNNRQDVFLDDNDRRALAEELSRTVARNMIDVIAFAFLTNHFHLILRTTASAPLRQVMQSLMTRYSKRFNLQHGRRGHLFQNCYRSILCDKDNYLLELVRYVHLNPVNAGLADSPAAWHWSSHRTYLGKRVFPWIETTPVLSFFKGRGVNARKAYARFIADRQQAGSDSEPLMDPESAAAIMGSGTFHGKIRRRLAPLRRRQSDADRHRRRFEDLLNEVADQHGIAPALLRGKSQGIAVSEARKQLLQLAVNNGWPQAHVARQLKRSAAWASLTMRRIAADESD